MFWIEKNGIACSILPKNGSTSIRQALATNDTYSNEEVLKFNIRVAFVREPIERLHSCYSFFHYLNRSNGNGNREINAEVTSSWEKFVDFTFKNTNPHFDPQVEQLSHDGKLVPNRIHKLDDMFNVWDTYWEGLFPWWCNKASRLPINNYRIDELKHKYKEDLSLWHSL